MNMGFPLPEPMKSSASATAKWLRDIEQNAPKTTSREIRDALVQAAHELERWEQLAQDAERQLTEAANVRISAMSSASNVEDAQRGVRSTMLELARQFRELA